MILRGPEKTDLVQLMAARIIDTIDKADRMIKDLLDSNLVQMGQKLPLFIEKCDLSALVKISVDDAITVFGNRFVYQYSSPVIGYWDSSILQRAIGNLLSNSVKYGDQNKMIKVSLKVDKNKVKISVHNFGESIPVSDQDHIFDNFYRSLKTGDGKIKGWGIGLYLVKASSIAHGGNVELIF